jgi:hypothetical protein
MALPRLQVTLVDEKDAVPLAEPIDYAALWKARFAASQKLTERMSDVADEYRELVKECTALERKTAQNLEEARRDVDELTFAKAVQVRYIEALEAHVIALQQQAAKDRLLPMAST